MRTKIIYLLSFYIFWLACSGFKIDVISMTFLFFVPLITFYVSNKLKLITSSSGNFSFLNFLKYFLWLVREVIISAVAVAKIAWRKNMPYQVIEPVISVQSTKLGMVVYANSITLTPGTVTLNVEGNNLLVHALDIKFMDDLQQGSMDSKVQECLKD